MKVFVTGACGQLGHDVMKELYKRRIPAIGSGRGKSYSGVEDVSPVGSMEYVSLDITDRDAVRSVLMQLQPDAVIHCAAWTAVDMAEDNDKKETVRNVNVNGTRYIAEICKAIRAKMLYISTDYVFDGRGTQPWRPDNREYRPLNVYGETKLEGEFAASSLLERFFIVRTSWVFGLNGSNFVKTMLEAGRTHDTVRVVNDQIGTPTYTCDLARLLADMIESEKYGCYHAVNEGGSISRYELCCELYRQAGLKTRVIPVSTAEYGLCKAVRPLNSRLDTSKLTESGFDLLPDWKDALRRYLLALN